MRGFAFFSMAALLIATWGTVPAGIARAEGQDRAPQAISPRTSDAAAGRTPMSGPSRSAGRTSSGWGTTGGALALIVVLILVAAKAFRGTRASGPMSLPDEAVQVLGRKSIDIQHAIHLVRCGSRILVLGSSQGGLRALAELTDREEVDSLAELCRSNESPRGTDNIAGWLRRVRSESEASPRDDEPDLEPEADPAVLRLRARLSMKAAADGPGRDFPPAPEASG
jgi:flagellar biogenesis protein FliO